MTAYCTKSYQNPLSPKRGFSDENTQPVVCTNISLRIGIIAGVETSKEKNLYSLKKPTECLPEVFHCGVSFILIPQRAVVFTKREIPLPLEE